MSDPVRYVPEGLHTVTPYLVVPDPNAVIDFLVRVFDAVEEHRTEAPGGRVMHAQVRVGDSAVMLGGADERSMPTAAMLYVYVEDTDATYRRAIATGAESLMEPADMFYGDRNAGVKDPAGNQWWIGTHLEDVSDEEMRRRMAEMGRT